MTSFAKGAICPFHHPTPLDTSMNAQTEPSSDQTQPSVQDGDGKRRLSVDDNALAKKLKLTTTKGAKGHDMNIKSDESQGEETVHRNLQDVYDHRHETESLHADTDGASNITKSRPLDNAAKEIAMTTSDGFANMGELEVDSENMNENMNNTWYESSLLSDCESLVSDISEGLGPDHFKDRDIDDQVMGMSPNLRAIPIAGGKLWNSLLSKESANIGDVVDIRKEGEQHKDFAQENQMEYSGESDEQEVLSVSPIEGIISAHKTQGESNTTNVRSPIPASEEQAAHNIESILASEEQTGGTGTEKDGGVDSDATSSQGNTLVPVEEEHYRVDFNCSAKYCINVVDLDRQEWEELSLVDSFSYASEDIRVGDIVNVITQESNDEALAGILEIKKPNTENSPNDDYFVLIFWYCTRQEIQQNKCKNIKAWPLGHSYMKTTHMEVILGTSIKDKLKDNDCICPGKVFDYVKRRIVNDTRKDVAWVG
jgi:hypothetical protein